jgi:autotransporter-associated beta strand protein
MAANTCYIENYTYTNDVGQIVFDGSGGFSNAPSSGGKMQLTIQENAFLYASNSGNLVGGYGNDCAQVLFGASGGFQYNHSGIGSAQVALEGSAKITVTNSGLLSVSSTNNDTSQILFDGSGGASAGVGLENHGSGNLTLSIQDAFSISTANSGTIGNITTNFGQNNNIGQIIFDGGGGLNSDGSGIGHLTIAFNSSQSITALNEETGVVSNYTGSISNKIGQILFDGGGGGTGGNGQGNLTVDFTGTGGIIATNIGTIKAEGTAKAIGQIVFDGSCGSSGSGSCTVQLGSDTTLLAANTATGSIQNGDQIVIYDAIVQGSGTLQAINTGGSVRHGIAFYGPSSMADGVQINLSGTSLWVDETVGSSFALGGISGDETSTATFHQNLTINTLPGRVNVFKGTISGTGDLVVSGTGQQLFTGSNNYTGATTVSGNGTRLTLVQSTIPGTLTVDQGGYFSGSGSVQGLATVSGTIKAGNSPGTLYFLSGLILTPSATTIAEIDTTQASLLAVSGGNANIAGNLFVLEDAGVGAGTTYPIVTVSGGSVVGTFENVTNTGSLLPVVLYSENEISLTLQNHAASFAALLLSNDRILRNIETLKHVDTRREHCIEQYTGRQNTIPPSNPWSVYLEPTGSFGHVKSKNNVYGSTYQTTGARFGFDYLWSDENAPSSSWCYGLGLIGEYNHFWGQMYQNAGTFESNSAYGSLYATFVPKAARDLSLNIIGGGGYGWYNFHRYPTGSSSFQTTGSPGGAQADALFDIEYTIQTPVHFRLTPMVALQYTYAHLSKYNEKGAGVFDLEVGHQSTNTLSTLLGLRLNYLFFPNSPITVRPEIMAQWQYQYLDSSIDTYWSAAPGTGPSYDSFNIPGFARNSLIAGADLRIELYQNMMLQLNYDLWYNKDALNNFFLLEYKIEF